MAKQRLKDLKAKEVSIVARGANKKTFLVVKEADADDKVFEVLDSAAKGEEEFMKSVKGDNPESRAVVKTAYRLLSGFKDKLTPEALILIAKGAGMEIAVKEKPSEITGGSQSEILKNFHRLKMISTRNLAKIAGVTEKVMKQVLEGEAEITDDGGIEALADFIKIEKARLAPTKKEGNKTMGKGQVFKDDGSLNMDVIPEESREIVSVLYKQSVDAQTESKKLASKIEKMENDQKKVDAIAKAKEFSHLGDDTEKLSKTLMTAREKLSKEEYDEFEDTLKKADKFVGDSAAFTEIGRSDDRSTSRPSLSTTGGEVVQEVLRKAQSLVEKNDKLDIAAAINTVLKTDPDLYDKYRNETAVKV